MNVKALLNAIQLLLLFGGGLSLSTATTTAKSEASTPNTKNSDLQDVQDLVDFFMERDVTGNEYPINDEVDVQDSTVVPRLRKSSQLEEHATEAAAKDTSTSNSNGFNIALGFTGKITNAQKQGFLNAKRRWQEIITKDAASTVCVKKGYTICGYKFTEATCIDDIFIGVAVKPMDGVGKIAGSAGPCSVDGSGKVRMGLMTFDSADANQLIKDGIWETTILHEMGHVLGIGTLWQYHGLAPQSMVTPPFYYQGKLGNEAHVKDNGGQGPIIIEDLGGYGTARAHWKEAVYDRELMTGYLEVKGIKSPISAMTIEALADLGYEVDKSKADPFTVQYKFPKTKSPTVPRKKKNRRKLLDMERLVVKTESLNTYKNTKKVLKEEYESNNDDDDKFGPNHKAKKVSKNNNVVVDAKKKVKKTTEPEYESNENDEDKFGPNHKRVKTITKQDDELHIIKTETASKTKIDKSVTSKTNNDEYESNENDEDKFGPNHAGAYDEAFTATARRRLEEQVAKGEKLFIGNDIADIDIVFLTPDSEGVEIKVKEGRVQEFEREPAKFTAKLMANTKASQ